MSGSQLPFDLEFRPALGAEDFLVAPCNEQAVAWVEKWPDWGAPALVIVGDEASGKSHLAQLWANRVRATIVDLARRSPPGPKAPSGPLVLDGIDHAIGDRSAEEAVFHRYTAATPMTGILITARRHPRELGFALADLASRLRAVPLATIGPPDDALIAHLLVKQFADRQLAPAPGLIEFLVARIERSYPAIRNAVRALDRASLSGKRPLTVPLAREVLDAG